MSDNLFQTASRRQLRFATNRGHCSVEDLWTLTLKSLDALACSIDEQIKPGIKSFLENPDKKASEAEADNVLRLEILKAVIAVKQDENKIALAESTKRNQKAFLLDLLNKKKVGEMESMTTEEIEAKLKELD